MSKPTESSEQTKLIRGVAMMRELLAAPTNLSSKEIRDLRAMVERVADACNFNAGWHSAAPGKKLSGAASTKKLSSDTRIITEFLREHAKKPKRATAGRPAGSVKPLDNSYLHVISDHLWGSGGKLSARVRDAAQKKLIDPSVPDSTHIRRVERYYEMISQKFAAPPPSNVIEFRTKKPS